MLPAEVYRAIYETAMRVESGDIVEIGTAHGAATIALAKGLDKGKVITVDKIRGGSRDEFGDIQHNIAIIQDNFKTFNVAEDIEFHAGTSLEIAAELPKTLKIGLLMLDADGAIDRDFKLFYDRVVPGAPIIIDDYQPGFVRFYSERKTIRMDQKRRLTALLLDYFVLKGYLKTETIIGETWFGTKPMGAPPIGQVNEEDIYDLYRKLIFATGPGHSKIAELIGKATRKFPGLNTALKSLYLSSRRYVAGIITICN
jgi:predicted O-methyltransferase YrrM